MMRVFALLLLLCNLATAQQLLVDPYLRTPSAWTVLNPTVTSIVQWNPLTIEARVTNQAQAGQVVGVRQSVIVRTSGYYQLVVHVDTWQIGQTGSMSFGGALGSQLSLNGSAYYGPDTRMVTGFVSAGTYDLELTTRSIFDYSGANYRMLFHAVFLYAVDLPCANVDLISGPLFYLNTATLRGVFSPGATLAMGLVSTHPYYAGLAIPGIAGHLLLDPSQGSGVVLLPQLNLPSGYLWYGPSMPWPALYFQLLEFDPSQPPGSELRLGSLTYTRY